MQPTQTKPTPTSPQRFAPPTKPAKKPPGKVASAFGFLIIIGVIALVIWGIVAIFSGHSKPHTSSTVKTATKTTTPATTSTPKTTTPTVAQQVSAWDSKYGSVFTTLSNDFGTLSNTNTSNTTALEAACTQIFDDATKAEGDPVIPDTATETDWSNALNDYVNGAQQCQYGVADSSSSDISQATTDFQQGNSSLDAANANIQKLE